MLCNSCVQGSNNAKSKLGRNANLTGNKNGSVQIAGGRSSATGDDSSGTGGNGSAVMSQKIELSHLVDPFDGTYKKKLTIPKNFKGNLYLAGLNIAALGNKLVSVRFNFGTDKQSVTLNATVARAPGIIPKTDIQVLVIDMNSKPFSKMRLGYDLYDYNDYETDTTKEPVTNGRDGGLYCRGLKLEDDPTFVAASNTSTCSAATDVCLYAYAKVVDSTLNGLLNSTTTRISSIPTRPQVWSGSSGSRSPTPATMATNTCLPDEGNSGTVLNQLFDLDSSLTFAYDGEVLTGRYYRGPYRAINESEWQISGAAIYFNDPTNHPNNKYGLYQSTASGAVPAYRSLLFPRAGKISLGQGVNYLGSADRFGVRTSTVSDSSGTSQYVDGCNIRSMNYDSATGEGIGSCTVNASIEVFYIVDNTEVKITTDKSIKLQLIRPSLTNYEGKEVLTTSFKRCENSTTCGSDECCYNNRCWSKELVTQCVDQIPVIGNQQIGANCVSDFECSSLCCSQSSGSCAPHNPNGTNPISCSKSAGQQCVSKEFCQQVPVVTCKMVKSGFKADGTTACTIRCPAVMTFGDCKSGSCVPPVQPIFDPNDPKNDPNNPVNCNAAPAQ